MADTTPSSRVGQEVNSSSKSDPSALTTDQLLRELSNLKAFLETRMDGSDKLVEMLTVRVDNFSTEVIARAIQHSKDVFDAIERGLRAEIITRLDGMDKALILLQTKADKVPSETDIAISHLQSLHEERFRGVDNRFLEFDKRADQRASDAKTAVDAAFAAADKATVAQNKSSADAIAKSEGVTIKSLDQQAALQKQTGESLAGQIADMKDRLTKMEGHSKGAGDTVAWILAAIGGFVGIASLAALVFAKTAGAG